MKDYSILIREDSLHKVRQYQEKLARGECEAGAYLLNRESMENITQCSEVELLEAIINTKVPTIFAESAVYGNGCDWNMEELSILGDISMSVSVTIFDNGLHYLPDVHENPFDGVLVYTPGALLANGTNNPPCDALELLTEGALDESKFFALYERRLLPCFRHIQQDAIQSDTRALVTVPGLGCGQFAGKYRGRLGLLLQRAIANILKKYSHELTSIALVYYDPYDECENTSKKYGDTLFRVRPLRKGNEDRPQLCTPVEYEEGGDDFSNLKLYSFVAWDHVSWPGNDYYIGSRATDDGVKAAATSSMQSMTGFEGRYSRSGNKYLPPEPYKTWAELVTKKSLIIQVKENLRIF